MFSINSKNVLQFKLVLYSHNIVHDCISLQNIIAKNDRLISNQVQCILLCVNGAELYHSLIHLLHLLENAAHFHLLWLPLKKWVFKTDRSPTYDHIMSASISGFNADFPWATRKEIFEVICQ